MISDILSQAVADLDRYLSDCTFDHAYIGETRERLVRLRNEADDLRSVLDTPPDATPAADDGPQQTASTRSRMIERMMAEETAVIPLIFSQKDLLGRGWSRRLIARLLGAPDSTSPNPHGAGYPPMKCWNQDRVVEVEATVAFWKRS